ncbi:unnamed protein product [Lactuca virosa]|uniref:Uncharacterized protein n=1 Tax=Lactuca virosa TaxID=75947 RepID=A0AAU9N5M1_9ASTR|nr:unnamed protein product [Lactuca virosa]
MEGSNDEEEDDDFDDDSEEPPQIDEVIPRILSISRVHSSGFSSDAGFSGGGLLIQSEMQHGSMNMVAGAQNVNGVAVSGPEEYLGNSRFSY